MVPTTQREAESCTRTIIVMHGFAVRLTGDEARRMSSFPGVTRVHEDRKFYLQMTRSPGFMGLDPHHGAWNETDFGDGVIIGLIDGGIWPESASFSDHGLGPVRSTWRGKCVDAADFNATLCNRKLVGARAFDVSQSASGMSYGTVPSPRDKDGHGTHVASTAAGAAVPDAGMFMFSRVERRGAWRPRRGSPCTTHAASRTARQRTSSRRWTPR
ncbi:hypothetical protein PR202_ga29411 [Eleusine coracana subsp. coracana]|uniref:Uncharacterized protein n=1 Tax=Eleusine coracana subsp. coracana TaxID=191504 RepID=A0AAV5DL34_ELECO|nr:hypothetical protein PR202_ga29411 [Eleusine coracana subsp. coracana]